MELEQQTYADSNTVHKHSTDCPERISGLRALLEGAPLLPECKLSWNCTLERILDGTRDGTVPDPRQLRPGTKAIAELHNRMEGLERLKDQMQAVGMSIAKTVSDRALFINYDTNPIPSGNAYP